MSVIVRGMDMPETCDSCDFCECDDTGYYCGIATETGRILVDVRKCRRDDCPLSPLPDEHGRLIDADALLEKAPELHEYLATLAPTVVPAERKDT